MSALDVIRKVETLGGRLLLDDGQLKVQAPRPLPADVLAEVGQEKASIMVALGAPVHTVVSNILAEIRPNLPASLKQLPDDKLLVLINWSIINAWNKGLRDLEWASASEARKRR